MDKANRIYVYQASYDQSRWLELTQDGGIACIRLATSETASADCDLSCGWQDLETVLRGSPLDLVSKGNYAAFTPRGKYLMVEFKRSGDREMSNWLFKLDDLRATAEWIGPSSKEHIA